jgi:hypothetical protein
VRGPSPAGSAFAKAPVGRMLGPPRSDFGRPTTREGYGALAGGVSWSSDQDLTPFQYTELAQTPSPRRAESTTCRIYNVDVYDHPSTSQPADRGRACESGKLERRDRYRLVDSLHPVRRGRPHRTGYLRDEGPLGLPSPRAVSGSDTALVCRSGPSRQTILVLGSPIVRRHQGRESRTAFPARLRPNLVLVAARRAEPRA